MDAKALAYDAVEINGIKIVIAKVDSYNARELRLAVDELKKSSQELRYSFRYC